VTNDDHVTADDDVTAGDDVTADDDVRAGDDVTADETAVLELLRRRAVALARRPTREAAGTAVQVILFELGGEDFAIEASCVLQVAVLRELTPLPGAAAPLFGVTHWRGEVLTILDLREALGVRARGVTDLGRIIVVDGPDRLFGVLADGVSDMTDMDTRRIMALPTEDASRSSLLRGVTEDGVLVMNTPALLERFGTTTRRRSNIERRGG
jgi:purine-binding chemotaxis protein CheW